MMGYGSYDNYWSMMQGGFGFAGILALLIVTVDLALLGVWLWKQIKK